LPGGLPKSRSCDALGLGKIGVPGLAYQHFARGGMLGFVDNSKGISGLGLLFLYD
jgi:hypothetical protein